MKRRNLTIAAVLFGAALLILLYTFLSKKNIADAIPETAIAVWKVEADNVIKVVASLPFLGEDQLILEGIDAIVDQSVTAVLQAGTPDQFSTLFLTKINKSTWRQLQTRARRVSDWQGVTVFTNADQSSIFAYHKGILMIAPHAIQVEQAITQLKEGGQEWKSSDQYLTLQSEATLRALEEVVGDALMEFPLANASWGNTWVIEPLSDSTIQFSTEAALPFIFTQNTSPVAFLNTLPAETETFVWSKKESTAEQLLAESVGKYLEKRDVSTAWMWSMLRYNNEWQPLYVFQLNKSGRLQLEQLQKAVDQVVMFDLYRGDNGHFFSFDNDYLWITKNQATLSHVLSSYIGGQTLAQEPSFLEAYAQVSQDQGAIFYARHDAINYLIKKHGNLKNDGTKQQLIDDTTSPRQFFLGFQNNDKTRATLQIVSGKERVAARTPATLEALPLEANLSTTPTLVKWKNQIYLLAQDESYRLYLFDIDGQLQWVKALDDKLQAPPQLLQNGRLFFQTAYKVYICDMEGVYREGYPFSLTSPSIVPICLLDFTGKGEYSYFIANEMGYVYGYDLERELLVGWSPKDTIGTTVKSIQHTQRKGDFVIIQADSSLQVFDRNGNTRFKVNDPLFSTATIDYQNTTNFARIVAASPNGKLKVINFKGEHFNLKFAPHRQFLFANVWGDSRKDYIAVQENEIVVFGYDEKDDYAIQYTIPLKQKVDDVFIVNNQIGTFQAANNELMLYNQSGQPISGFPLSGNTPFLIEKNILYTGGDTEILRYQLFQ